MKRIVGSSTAVLLAILILFAGVAGAGEKEVEPIEAVLDDFHAAASEADEERYFGHLAPGAVFLGTDATERWTKEEFRAYAHPHFSKGNGWTYQAKDRWITLAADGRTAWFDEALHNAKYGETRGSGALQLYDGEWKIEQYNLTIPVPNELANELVERIREQAGDKADH